MKSFTLLALLGFLALVAAWTKEDHEIFRLKDELERFEGPGVSFYDFLDVSPSANQDEINKAYRKKSKLLHPDKAKQSFLAERATAASKSAASKSKSAAAKSSGAKKPKPTTHVTKPPSERELRAATKRATDRFTRLGLIANILRGEGRARYDHFLANGFPAWRGADYYYARFRPGLGSVLLGLFVAAGGGAHYLALIIGWHRQRDFVKRYIEEARKLAWGDSSAVAGIPGIDNAGSTAAVSSALPADDDGTGTPTPMNRRDRRNQEKQNKKPSAAARRAAQQQQRSGTSTPQEGGNAASSDAYTVEDGNAGPVPGPKKRVQAENGKTLVVDSAGNVFLEALAEPSEEDGEPPSENQTQLYMLDPDEIARPTFRDTVLWRLPAWMIWKAQSLVTGRKAAEEEENEEDGPSGAAIQREKVRSKAKAKFNKRKEQEEKAAAAAAAVNTTPSPPDVGESSEIDGFVDVRDIKFEAPEAGAEAGTAKAEDDDGTGDASGSKKKKKKKGGKKT